jgi:hypothetical protein
MINYYLYRDGQNHGPYSADQMKQLVTSGQVAQGELICPEGGSDWVPASTLLVASSASSRTVAPASVSSSAGSRDFSVTEEQVSASQQKLKTPIIGILISVAVPFLLWAAKSDASRGVRISGKHRGLKSLMQTIVKENPQALPIAIAIGVIGVVVCAVWFARSRKVAKDLKAEFNRQQIR